MDDVASLPAPPVAPTKPHTWDRPTGSGRGPLRLAAAQGRPRHGRLPGGREHLLDRPGSTPTPARSRQLFDEIRSRIQETDESVPVRHGAWWYVTRTIEGQSYPVFCRGTADRPRRRRHPRLQRRGDGARLLRRPRPRAVARPPPAGLVERPRRQRAVHAARARPGDRRRAPRRADRHVVVGRRGLVERRAVAVLRPPRRADAPPRDLASPPRHARSPTTSWSRPSPTCASTSTCRLTRSERWLVITSNSRTSSEVSLIPADDPTRRPRPRAAARRRRRVRRRPLGRSLRRADQPRRPRLPRDDRAARRPGRLDRAAPPRPGPPVHPGRAVRRPPRAARVERRPAQGARAVRRRHARTPSTSAPSPTTSSSGPTPSGRRRRCASSTRRSPRRRRPTTSMSRAASACCASGRRRRTSSSTATPRCARGRQAPDGTKVPVDVVRHVDTPLDGTAPAVVYGYGSYEASIPPYFSAARLSLLDRGVVWALVHPRGGGELGRAWWLDGRLTSKRNTFTDTMACADHLAAERFADPRAPRAARRQRRRPPRRRVHHDAPGAVPCRRRRGPVRRRRHDDERRDPAAHRQRVGGVGRPARRAVRVVHAELLALRQHRRRRRTRRCTSRPG